MGLVCVAATAVALGQVDPNRVLIVVNGTKVTGASYYKRMELLPGMGRMVGQRFVDTTPGYLTLANLVNEALMIQLAKEKGVSPSATQIDKELADRKADDPDYEKNFTALGFTVEDVRYDLLVQMSEFNLQTMGINIADQQVETYYKDRIREFTIPQRYRIRVIAATSPEDKTKIDGALGAGRKFADVAKEMSRDITTKFDGGLMGDVAEEALGTNIRSLVKGMKESSVTPWLEGASGTEVKIYLEKVLPEETLPLNDKLKRAIRRKLMLERGGAKNNMYKMMAEARQKAKVEFQGTPFDDQIRQMLEGGF